MAIAPSAGKGPDNSPNSVVVRVNGAPILQKKIDREVATMIPGTYYHATLSEEKLKPIREQAIEKMINRELIYQHALDKGFAPSSDQVQSEEEKNIKAYGGNVRFRQLLAKNNLSVEEYRREVAAEMTVARFVEKEIRVALSNSDIKEYYETNKGKFKEPEKIHLKMIYIQRNPQEKNSAQAAMKKAKEALDKLNKGTQFEQVATEYSNGMHRVKGGDMGLIHKGVLDSEEVEKTAFGLKVGEMSKILQTEMGCFILLVVDKIEPTQLPFSKVRVELKKDLTEKREKEKMDDLLDTLKKRAKIVKS